MRWTPRHEAYAKLFTRWQHHQLGVSCPERIFVLYRGDRLNRLGTAKWSTEDTLVAVLAFRI